jgi:heat shock protein HtpX
MLNTLKVGILLTLLTAAFLGFGYLLGGRGGMVMAFGFAVLMNFGSYWFSDKIVLSMSGAKPVGPQDAPELYKLTSELVQRANLPMPRLYIIQDPQPNAFATGRSPKHAAVAVNTGLLQLLDRREVEGVIAHELAHVKHRDTLTMAIVATLAGAIMLLADLARWSAIFGLGSSRDNEEGANPLVLLAMIIVAPLAAMMVQFAVSRAREYEADAMAARLTGSPDGLINALMKLDRGVHAIPTHSMSPQTAHLCIANPFAGMGGLLSSLFSTHPPMEKRIAALEALRPQIRTVTPSPWG